MPTGIAGLRRRARALVSALAYLTFLLACGELGARWFLASEARFLKVGSAVTDPSWRLAWLHRQARQGRSHPAIDVPHATRGWALRAGLQHQPAWDGKRVSSSSDGLRGRREYARPKPPGVRRVLVFGDSFTFGEEVSDDETFCHRLSGLLPGVEVLNMGVRGYGHDQMLLYLREAAARYEPDLILLGYVTDDALRNLMTFRDFAKPRFTLRQGRLVLQGTPVPSPEELLRREPWRSKLLDLVTMLSQQWAWRSGARPREARDLTLAILSAFFDEAAQLGAQAALVDLPAFDELSFKQAAPLPREAGLMEFCRGRALPYLGLRPVLLDEERRGQQLKGHGHWGPAEHAIAAQALAAFVQSRRLLAPRTGAGAGAGWRRLNAVPRL